MSGRGARPLSREDRVLWARVAETLTPLKGKAPFASVPFAPPAGDEAGEGNGVEVLPAVTAPAAAPAPGGNGKGRAAADIDLPTRRKLARGRLPIEGVVDLHGLTQTEAHALLLSFLHRAHEDGRRHVLVVTGKGASMGSDGVLRRAVPAWLATPAFRGLVSGHEPAARNHGGGGALYIRLRSRARGGAG